jgi:hypothetical protein
VSLIGLVSPTGDKRHLRPRSMRHEYQVMREGFRRSGRTLPDHPAARRPTPWDLHGLAALMDDAYRCTIDSGDETLEQAVGEVTGYLQDDAMLDLSLVAETTGRLDSAILVSRRSGPVVAYVMTRAAAKNRGLAACASRCGGRCCLGRRTRRASRLHHCGERPIRDDLQPGRLCDHRNIRPLLRRFGRPAVRPSDRARSQAYRDFQASRESDTLPECGE